MLTPEAIGEFREALFAARTPGQRQEVYDHYERFLDDIGEWPDLPPGVTTNGVSDWELINKLESYRLSVTRIGEVLPALEWSPNEEPVFSLREMLVELEDASVKPVSHAAELLRRLPEYKIPVWFAGLLAFLVWGLAR